MERVEDEAQSEIELIHQYQLEACEAERKKAFRLGREYFYTQMDAYDCEGTTAPFAIRGFEDVLEGNTFANGVFLNTGFNGAHLPIILATQIGLGRLEKICQEEGRQEDAGRLVRRLREERALSGKRIVDLASGAPFMAKVLDSLGAEVRTVDGYAYSSGLDINSHIAGLDLNREDAYEQIAARFGQEGFDVVHEAVVGGTRENRFDLPTKKNLLGLTSKLLKPSGYFVTESLHNGLLRKQTSV